MNLFTTEAPWSQAYRQAPDPRTGETGAPVAPSRESLVTTPISHRKENTGTPELHFFNRSIRVKHYGTGNPNNPPPDRSGKQISSYSSKSQSRLRHVAVNNSHRIKSQFGLTYHKHAPTDGKLSKKHLDAWLKVVRRNFPNIGYLWMMEFQSRNAAHYHVFFTCLPSQQMRLKLATAWNRITGETPEHLRVHDHDKNWIPWTIGRASYLAKYIDKKNQKLIPEGYSNFGRFWGHSSDMKTPFLAIPLEELDEVSTTNERTGEIYGGKTTILRWLGRLAEKQTNGYSRFRSRVERSSYTILDGSAGYNQIELYFSRLSRQHRLSDLHERITERGYGQPLRTPAGLSHSSAFPADANVAS